MRKLLLSSALMMMFIVLSQSQAQEFDRDLFKLFGAVQKVIRDNPALLASNQGVQKELKMDEEQVAAVREKIGFSGGFGFGGRGKGQDGGVEAKERLMKFMEKVRQLKEVPEDKLEARIREVFKEEIEGPTKAIETILKPEQLARLKQIARQQGGAAAYLKPENVKDLSITDEQKSRLKDIISQLDKDLAELRSAGLKGGFGPLPPETREKMIALSKQANEKADSLLTGTQTSKWKELIGQPYTVQFGFSAERPRPKKDD